MLRRLLSDASRAWDIPERGILEIWLAPFVIALAGAATALGGKQLYKWFTSEDGVAETMQVLFYALALVLCVFVIVRVWRGARRGVAVLYALAAIGLVFMLGEELSWGQRLVGWDTPASIRDINKQQETNLHNIYGVGSTFKWLQLLVGAYGTLLPIMVLKLPALKKHRRSLAWIVPHYSLIPYFALLFVWRVYRNLFDAPRELYFVVAEYNEVLELVLAVGIFLFMVFQLRSYRVREQSTHVVLSEPRQERPESEPTQRRVA